MHSLGRCADQFNLRAAGCWDATERSISEMKTRARFVTAAVIAVLVATAAAPLVAVAQQPGPDRPGQSAPAAGWREPLRPLWTQLEALRAQHAGLNQQLRQQHIINMRLDAQIRAGAGGGLGEVRALMAEFRAFVEEQMRPLRVHIASLMRALAEAVRNRDRQAIPGLRGELSAAKEQLRQLQEDARALSESARALREATAPKVESVRAMRQQLDALRQQAREIRALTHSLHGQLAEQHELLRAHAAKQQVEACEECLVRIIALKAELIGLTQQLLNLARQAEQILRATLSQLQG